MPHSNAIALDQHADHIKSVRLVRTSMTSNPSGGRPGELALLRSIHRFDGIPKLEPAASLHLDERDHSVPRHNEVDVAVPDSKSPLNNTPSIPLQPTFGDSLAQLPELLLGR